MNSRSIIIAILIFIKVIGIVSRARAESFYSLDCSSNWFAEQAMTAIKNMDSKMTIMLCDLVFEK